MDRRNPQAGVAVATEKSYATTKGGILRHFRVTYPLAYVLLLALLFCLQVHAEPRFQYESAKVKTVLNQGPGASHFDVVFVGDGYTVFQADDFDRDVRDACSSLWKFPFFADYKQHFNVHSVFVPSIKEGSQLDYAFGSHLSNDNRNFILLSKRRELEAVTKKAPDCDAIVVITTMAGRAHASDIIVLASRTYEPLPHELGHKIGHLGDEYSSTSHLADRSPLNFGGGDIPYPNLTLDSKIDPKDAQSVKKTAKWKHFLDLPGAFPLVSAYQGGYYQEVGVWRPSYACIMRGAGDGFFCPVCHEEMAKALYLKCGIPFNDGAYHLKHPLTQWRR